LKRRKLILMSPLTACGGGGGGGGGVSSGVSHAYFTHTHHFVADVAKEEEGINATAELTDDTH
jgi:hypothetical protein